MLNGTHMNENLTNDLIRDSPDAFMSKEESGLAHACCFVVPQYKGYCSFGAPQDFHSEVYCNT